MGYPSHENPHARTRTVDQPFPDTHEYQQVPDSLAMAVGVVRLLDRLPHPRPHALSVPYAKPHPLVNAKALWKTSNGPTTQLCHQIQHHLLQDLRIFREMLGVDSHVSKSSPSVYSLTHYLTSENEKI